MVWKINAKISWKSNFIILGRYINNKRNARNLTFSQDNLGISSYR